MNKKLYNVAIYIRLSREDEVKDKFESESITNQRNFILDYINKADDTFNIYDEYVDDGYSGTNFERPAFKRLINDIEIGKINCVITKDYSRLGRDYIKSGEYLEKYFPKHNIRYIAILDGIDTLYDNISNDFAPFKAVLNDQYAKDISKKVRSSLNSKKKNGKFLGWKAVYGYKLDENDRYKLVIDEEAAKVVKRIFKMAYEGMSCKAIADTLSQEKIPIPSIYGNLNRGIKSSSYGLWCSRTISDILKNETYIGNLTQGKRRVINYKIKKEIRVPKEEWIVIKDTHEPIIDKRIFEVVQSMYKSNRNTKKDSKEYLLRGLLFCKECNHKITISTRSDTRAYISCSYYQKYSKFNVCTPHTWNYYELEKIVLTELQNLCQKYINIEQLINILEKEGENNQEKANLELKLYNYNLEKNKLIKRKKQIYYDKLDNIISLEEYQKYTNEINNDILLTSNKIKKYQDQIFLLSKESNNKFNYNKIVNDYLLFKKPSKRLIASLINKITVDKNRQVTIEYKIKKPS